MTVNERYENQVIFFEPDSLYQDCTFFNCTFVYYEFGGAATLKGCTILGGYRILSFSRYMEEFNKPKKVEINTEVKQEVKVPWYVNKGGKW